MRFEAPKACHDPAPGSRWTNSKTLQAQPSSGAERNSNDAYRERDGEVSGWLHTLGVRKGGKALTTSLRCGFGCIGYGMRVAPGGQFAITPHSRGRL
jgi:hypothetical protein